MLSELTAIQMSKSPVASTAADAQPGVARDPAREAELRRSMYQRIAQGNALAEVEEAADRKRNGT